ncbi:transcriptional regulator [Mycolicibacterium cyprinidarum]|nr:transcriptional regulator [Mycolicibacterium sp. NGTWS1803]
MEKKAGALGPGTTPTAVTDAPLSRQRLAVLEDVRAHAPVRVAGAAARLGVHANTVREHLDALVGLGRVERTTETPGGRGRPAALYRPSGADPVVQARDFAGLAAALAGHLARTSSDPESDARAAGMQWGRELIDGAVGADDDPRGAVLDILTRLGFAPDADDSEVVADGAPRGIALRRCPLLEVARRYPAVVCRVHLGIVEGLLEQLGATTEGLDLIAFAEPGACRLLLPDPTGRATP